MTFAAGAWRQRDGFTCGPAVAVLAGSMLDPDYGPVLRDAGAGDAWFAREQSRVHARANAVWPRRLGTTPAGMARALTERSRARGVRYRWRWRRGRCDRLADVLTAVGDGWPVAVLIGGAIPRHWVLLLDIRGDRLRCYEPSCGATRPVSVDALRRARLSGLGYPRAFAFVLPSAFVVV